MRSTDIHYRFLRVSAQPEPTSVTTLSQLHTKAQVFTWCQGGWCPPPTSAEPFASKGGVKNSHLIPCPVSCLNLSSSSVTIFLVLGNPGCCAWNSKWARVPSHVFGFRSLLDSRGSVPVLGCLPIWWYKSHCSAALSCRASSMGHKIVWLRNVRDEVHFSIFLTVFPSEISEPLYLR